MLMAVCILWYVVSFDGRCWEESTSESEGVTLRHAHQASICQVSGMEIIFPTVLINKLEKLSSMSVYYQKVIDRLPYNVRKCVSCNGVDECSCLTNQHKLKLKR
jgi:hypothetical protein